MSVRKSAARLVVTCERDLVEWLRREGRCRDRSLAWLFQEAVRQWRNRLECRRARLVGQSYTPRKIERPVVVRSAFRVRSYEFRAMLKGCPNESN